LSIITKEKARKDVLSAVAGSEGVLVLGCHGCAEDSSTGGPEQVHEMAAFLEREGIKTFTLQSPCITYLCWERSVEKRFDEIEAFRDEIDTILILACGTAISCMNACLKRHAWKLRIVPGLDTIGIGHVPLEGKSEITCSLCGNCRLVQDSDEYHACAFLKEYAAKLNPRLPGG
jgi:hypothetical protein